ncbi:hypothetical protein [Providencia rustigianii]|uniref:hypothetical protein n=1 Tax=Providencia rustigianii TaxID=158850 RepID=UPI002242D26D|nr:hypothetical protein [Providencia rustigianii]
MFKIHTALASVVLISGCAYNPIIPPSGHYTKPSIGQTNEVGVGEIMFSSIDGAKVPTVTVSQAEGKLSIISAGTYCEYEKGSGKFINPENKNAVLLKTLTGRVVDSSGQNYLFYNKEKNEISAGNGAPFNSSEINISYNQDGICAVGGGSLSRTIEYNGKNGDVLSFVYREFNGSMSRPSFTTEFSTNINETKNIRYKGATIEVNSANGSEIKYTVVSDFK